MLVGDLTHWYPVIPDANVCNDRSVTHLERVALPEDHQ